MNANIPATRLVLDCVIVVGGLALCWPNAFPKSTSQLRGFRRGMRCFAVAVVVYGVLGLSQVFGIQPWKTSTLGSAKLVVVGIIFGILTALVVSGLFQCYLQAMLGPRSDKAADKGSSAEEGDS